MDVLMLKSFRLVFALQIILGIVFVFSGITKLIDINAFAEALVNFKLLNDNFITIVKYAIPIIEIILGIGIIFNFNSSFPSFISSLSKKCKNSKQKNYFFHIFVFMELFS